MLGLKTPPPGFLEVDEVNERCQETCFLSMNWDTIKIKRRDPDLNRDILAETGSQGQRNTGLCDRGSVLICILAKTDFFLIFKPTAYPVTTSPYIKAFINNPNPKIHMYQGGTWWMS